MPTRKDRRRRTELRRGQSAGPATDSQNDPVIDPTENVLALVSAAIQRQDDLRNLTTKHLEEMATLRAQHARELSRAETARIDAIRAVDVGAVNRAAEVASTQASTLAAQVATSAEAMRVQVAAAAAASNINLNAALEPIQRNVAELRQVQFQQQGERQSRSDDRDTRVIDRGQSNWLIGILVGVGLFIVAEIIKRGGF